MIDQIGDIAFTASVWILPVLLAVTLHEAAHGYVAWVLGDDTAKQLGRVTLNPLVHIDRFGTVILPGLLLLFSAPFLFGYAKPVPVSVGRLNHPRRDMMLVAVAGPLANIILALLAAIMFHLLSLVPDFADNWVARTLLNMFQLNLILAVFNLLPIPPLDGGRILTGALPYPLAVRLAALERFGMMLIVGGLFLLPFLGKQFGYSLDIFGWFIGVPTEWLGWLLLTLTGHG
ncbi:MAG: site-2 protease family protein [Rhodospirillaceae bacterium]